MFQLKFEMPICDGLVNNILVYKVDNNPETNDGWSDDMDGFLIDIFDHGMIVEKDYGLNQIVVGYADDGDMAKRFIGFNDQYLDLKPYQTSIEFALEQAKGL